MHVTEILARKGTEVATVAPDDSVTTAVATLAEFGVGALVVSSDGKRIDGIVSERDVVRAIGTGGGAVLSDAVATIMTADVWTCGPSDTLEQLMGRMTEHRIRHLPVSTDGALSGIVSIGDVVKWRVSELEDEAKHIQDYIQSSGYS